MKKIESEKDFFEGKIPFEASEIRYPLEKIELTLNNNEDIWFKKIFSKEYVPLNTLSREFDKNKLIMMLNGAVGSANILIYGTFSTGKTVTIRSMFKEWEHKEYKEKGIHFFYIHCNGSLRRIYESLFKNLGREMPKCRSYEDMASCLRDLVIELNTERLYHTIIICLDEVDAQYDHIKELGQMIYQLQDECDLFSTFLICNKRRFVRNFGEKEFTRITPMPYPFEKYNPSQIWQIVQERIKEAFEVDDVYEIITEDEEIYFIDIVRQKNMVVRDALKGMGEIILEKRKKGKNLTHNEVSEILNRTIKLIDAISIDELDDKKKLVLEIINKIYLFNKNRQQKILCTRDYLLQTYKQNMVKRGVSDISMKTLQRYLNILKNDYYITTQPYGKRYNQKEYVPSEDMLLKLKDLEYIELRK